MGIRGESETYMLAPADIVEKARRLRSQGEYRQALDLLAQHAVRFNIYPEYGQIALSQTNRRRKERPAFSGETK